MMSSLRVGGIALVSVLITAFPWALVSCSDDTTPSPGPGADGSTAEAGPDGGSVPDRDAGRTCRQACEETHKDGLAKDEAVNTCWEDRCIACVEPGADAGAPEDAGDAGDAGACQVAVVTPSSACDTCTRASCCAAWDACFQDPACTALNVCYQTCTE